MTDRSPSLWSRLRLRQSPHLRDLCAETVFTGAHLIQPLFIVEGLTGSEPITGLGDNARLGERESLDVIARLIEALRASDVIDTTDMGLADALWLATFLPETPAPEPAAPAKKLDKPIDDTVDRKGQEPNLGSTDPPKRPAHVPSAPIVDSATPTS